MSEFNNIINEKHRSGRKNVVKAAVSSFVKLFHFGKRNKTHKKRDTLKEVTYVLQETVKENAAVQANLQDELNKLREEYSKLQSTHEETLKKLNNMEIDKIHAENDVELNIMTIEDLEDQLAELKEDNIMLKEEIEELNYHLRKSPLSVIMEEN